MKIEKNFLLLVENFLLDDKKRASLINLYDQIWGSSLPMLHPKLLYVANIKVTNASVNQILLDLIIFGPNKKVIFETKGNTDKTTAKLNKGLAVQSVGVVFDIKMIQFELEGAYSARLVSGSEVLAEHAFEVKQLIPEEA